MPNKIAIIGLGIMGRRLLENAVIHPQFEVSGVWDPADSSIDKARQVFADAPVAIDATAAMAGADVVYLACPPAPRKAYALAAAEAGKGVFMEKPLGTDNAASRDLVLRLEQARLRHDHAVREYAQRAEQEDSGDRAGNGLQHAKAGVRKLGGAASASLVYPCRENLADQPRDDQHHAQDAEVDE